MKIMTCREILDTIRNCLYKGKRVFTLLIIVIILILLLYPIKDILIVSILIAILTPTRIDFNVTINPPSYSFYITYIAFFIVAVLLLSILLSYFIINSSKNSEPPLHLNTRRLGMGFLIAGILTALLITLISHALIVTSTDPLQTFQEIRIFSDMYLQISLNLLLGGATLVGASLVPLLQQSSKQCGCCKTEKQQQSSGGESGSGQQDK